MAASTRRVHGPRPLGALLPAITRPAFRLHPAATAQVMLDWETLVGPALAAVTFPQRLAAGTLTIACAGPVAMELQHAAPQIIERINRQLGNSSVARLRFTQATRASKPALPKPPPAPDPRIDTIARDRVASLPEGPLRDALEGLGRAVFTAQSARLRRRR